MFFPLTDIIEACKNLVGVAGVESGDGVLVLADTLTDAVLPRLVSENVRARGGTAVICISAPFPLYSIPRPVFSAAGECEVLISVASNLIVRNKDEQTLRSHGVRIAQVASPDIEVLGSDAAFFPMEVMEKLLDKCADSILAGKHLALTDKKGTHFEADFDQSVASKVKKGTRIGKGGLITFPLGVTGIEPLRNGEGKLCWDSVNGTPGWNRTWGHNVECTVKQGKCKEIAGGEIADALTERIKLVRGSEEVLELQWGLNPKMAVEANMEMSNKVPVERHAGVVHVGLGSGYGTGGLHIDGEILAPSLYIDDKPLILEGKLLPLEDKEVIQVAEKYGDPAEVLSRAS